MLSPMIFALLQDNLPGHFIPTKVKTILDMVELGL